MSDSHRFSEIADSAEVALPLRRAVWPRMFARWSKGVPGSLWAIPLILAVENTVVVQIPHPWFVIYLYRGIPIVFGLALLFMGAPRLRGLGREYFTISRRFAAIHMGCVALFAAVELFLVRSYPVPNPLANQVAVGAWLLLLAAMVVTALGTFIPFSKQWAVARRLGWAWAFAALSSALVVVLREVLRLSWETADSPLGRFLQNASFSQARAILRLFYPGVISEPATHLLGTQSFQVEVSGTCSGIEGLALCSAFMLTWFVFARRELRLGRAMLLVPVALGMMWLMNLGRLVTLIGIGSAGYPRVAVNGFHSEAGWIAFVVVSLGFLLAAQNIAWFQRQEALPSGRLAELEAADAAGGAANPAVIYLLPFLAITAAAMVSQALSGGFEWFYPLRFCVVCLVFWVYRAQYRKIDWRCGWVGAAAGVAVAGMWLFAQFAANGWRLENPKSFALYATLTQLPAAQRIGWILVRVLAAGFTVPIAEELAFRGYIARRLLRANVDAVEYSQMNLVSIAVSSIAFGLMHGSLWLAGMVAGVVFALAARSRNRLGEAVGAHAVANLILAVVALATHDYTIW